MKYLSTMVFIAMSAIGLLFAPQSVNAQPAPFATFELASEPVLHDPHDLTMGPDGRLYIADKFANEIVIMNAETLTLIGSFGQEHLLNVHDISFGPDGLAYVADTGNGRIAVFKINGNSADLVGSLENAPRVEGALAHPNGRIYASSGNTGELIMFENGKRSSKSAFGHFGAHDVEVDLQGNIWIADNFGQRLVKYSPELEKLQTLDDAKYGFGGPRYLSIDGQGNLIVADQDAHRILLINPNKGESGELIGAIGDGLPGKGPNKFDDPEGALYYGGSFYFSDSDNNRIVRSTLVMN